LLFFLNR